MCNSSNNKLFRGTIWSHNQLRSNLPCTDVVHKSNVAPHEARSAAHKLLQVSNWHSFFHPAPMLKKISRLLSSPLYLSPLFRGNVSPHIQTQLREGGQQPLKNCKIITDTLCLVLRGFEGNYTAAPCFISYNHHHRFPLRPLWPKLKSHCVVHPHHSISLWPWPEVITLNAWCSVQLQCDNVAALNILI